MQEDNFLRNMSCKSHFMRNNNHGHALLCQPQDHIQDLSLRIPLMPTDDSEVMPTGVPLRSRPMFRWNADRLMMQ